MLWRIFSRNEAPEVSGLQSKSGIFDEIKDSTNPLKNK